MYPCQIPALWQGCLCRSSGKQNRVCATCLCIKRCVAWRLLTPPLPNPTLAKKSGTLAKCKLAPMTPALPQHHSLAYSACTSRSLPNSGLGTPSAKLCFASITLHALSALNLSGYVARVPRSPSGSTKRRCSRRSWRQNASSPRHPSTKYMHQTALSR